MPNWYDDVKDSRIDAALEARYIATLQADVVVPATDEEREYDMVSKILIQAASVAENNTEAVALTITPQGNYTKVQR